MIAPNISGGSICLRCRLRLLRQYNQPYQISTSHIFNIFKPQQQQRCFATQSPLAANHNPFSEANDENAISDHHKDPHDPSQGRDYGGSNTFEGARKPALLKSKRRLSRNRILTEDSQKLDSSMLGKPASVIVMRDGGIYKRKHAVFNSRRTDGTDGTEDEPIDRDVDIQSLLDIQQEPPTAQEARKNIDSLRPKTETALSEREFRKLQASLMHGFLKVQLIDYLDRNKDSLWFESGASVVDDADVDADVDVDVDADADSGNKSTTGRANWIKHITPWAPLGSQLNIPEGVDPSTFGYITDPAPPKEKLAVRIMRECWNLSIGELDTGLGETRVTISSSEFLLLMRGTQRWMSVMGQVWLDPGEKIEAFRDKKMLRFVTTKPKAAILVKALHDTIKQITYKTFGMYKVADEPIDNTFLEEVGRITNTLVRRNQASSRILVTWIELKSRVAQGLVGLENLSEVVFRLLLIAFTPRPGTTFSLHVAGLDDQTGGRFVVDATSKEKLGWKDKLSQWSRYTLPLAPEDSRLAVKSKSTLPKLAHPVEPNTEMPQFDGKREFLPDSPFPAHVSKWSHHSKVSTKAKFGYLLHKNDPSTSPPPLPELLNANHPRAFAPLAAHPLYLARLEASNDEAAHALIQTKTTVVIHLWPQRTSKKYAPVYQAPLLELHLATSGSKVEGVESMRAIEQTHTTDVMLPASLVDIRFTQEKYWELEGEPGTIDTWQPFTTFLGPARLDLERGKFDMPPQQKFPIPKRLLSYSDPNFPSTTGAESATPDGLVGVPYTLAGVQVRRSVSMPFEGFQLTYTSVDMERAGGHQTEVSLEPGLTSETEVANVDSDKLHDHFLATCERFARTDALWSGNVVIRRNS
ncbi:mitochondrial inner-membrane-bound regulator-domain-containing protein [Rostrohypoxylon terebratum]|nr:mitochondrial inner-membrane-bound regulator-domain-containing protein [Rostrohypoxylon terebratum]